MIIKRIFLSIILIALSATISLAENPSVLYIIGDLNGWNWDNATEMQSVSGMDGEYSWTGNLEVGEFKIYAQKNPTWNELVPFYHPTYNGCEVSQAGVASNEVVFTTEPDNKWKVTEAGQYTITINITTLTISVTYLGAPVKSPIDTETLYLIGDICGWNMDNPTPCVKKDKNVFVYEGELPAGSFQATPVKGSSNWGAKFILPTSNCNITKAGLTDYEFDYSADHTNSWIVDVAEAGTYTLTFDLNKWILNVKYNVESGVSELITDKNAPVEYYNLQGVRVEDPANGLYLVRKGGKVSKVMIK